MHPQGGTYAPAAAPGDPAPLQFQKQPLQSQWSTGLYDCCDDAGNCYKTCLCPCITFGQIAEIIDKGSTSSGCSCLLYALYMYVFRHKCLYACSYRVRMREQYGLPEDPCNDFCVHICCEACSLCQMYRELKNRGFDMDIGWHANMARQGQTKMAPPMYQDMKR